LPLIYFTLTEAKRGKDKVPNLPAVIFTGRWPLMIIILAQYL
jgi:hypothetical protein